MSLLQTDRMDTAHAASYTGLTSSTLTKRRVFGDGPRYIKLGRRVVYDVHDLDEWLNSRKRGSTSEYG